MKNMTGGQLTQIYNIATQQGCGQDEIQSLIESGCMADFFTGRWQKTDHAGPKFIWLSKLSTLKPDFETLCTIKLGTGIKSGHELHEILTKGCEIDNWGSAILNDSAFIVSPEEIKVRLVAISVAELGFKDGAVRVEIYKRAKELGLRQCPSEVGPQLCLQHPGKLKGEYLHIAMEPIIVLHDVPSGFVVGQDRNDEISLSGDNCRPDSFWTAKVYWVFLQEVF